MTIGKPSLAEAAVQAPSLYEGDSNGSDVAPAVRRIGSSTLAGETEQSLPRACGAYWAVTLDLDRSLSGNEDLMDSVGLHLHRQWMQALLRVLSLPAETADGERAKSAVLRDAVEIVLGHEAEGNLGSEQLVSLLRPRLHP